MRMLPAEKSVPLSVEGEPRRVNTPPTDQNAKGLDSPGPVACERTDVQRNVAPVELRNAGVLVD